MLVLSVSFGEKLSKQDEIELQHLPRVTSVRDPAKGTKEKGKQVTL